VLAVVAVGFTAVSAGAAVALVSDPASLVNPFIGTANNANDFPGATSPFGMVQWSPDTTTRPKGGGYLYAVDPTKVPQSPILGFSLNHIAGPGCAAEGDVPVLPTVGNVNTDETQDFKHTDESANAGYYRVTTANGVKTELTTTPRSGMARFTFPSSTKSNLIFKMTDSATTTSAAKFHVVSKTEVSGQVTAGHFCSEWGADQGKNEVYTLYFDMVFDQPFTSDSGDKSDGAGSVTFDTTKNKVVQAKVGISYVSVANATANRTAENTGWDFDTTHTAAHKAWNSMLSRVAIAGGTSDQQKTFYTALYHSLLHPSVFSDTNGQYPGMDGKTHTVDTGHGAFYTTFSGWDIYRSQAQLSALVAPTVASDIAQSMVDDYKQTGLFPKWVLNNGETDVMVGDPAAAIIADYYAFGARNFDTATALRGLIREATIPNQVRPGLTYLEQRGYLPIDGSYAKCCNFYGPTSTSLEYNTADAAISFLAGALGDTANQAAFINRAQHWRNLFNYKTKLISPRNANGSFPASGDDGFVEGNAQTYTLMVPFNIRGLADAEGGNTALNAYLDNVLTSFTGEPYKADVTNEPSLDIPWEYDYIGAPSKTQKAIRQIQDKLWSNKPDGLDGPSTTLANDDLGSMSAWYVWSALGFYPETPGSPDLALGSPMFTQEVIKLPSGKTLTINGNGAADDAMVVKSATWQDSSASTGSPWNNAYMPTSALAGGGTLTFTLGGKDTSTTWATATSAAPPSYDRSPAYNNTGISDDSAASKVNFDLLGHSYSAQALDKAGVTPGSTITVGGLSYLWPGTTAAQPDNDIAGGQVIPADGAGSISFLGSASNGPSTGTAKVTYTDGTTQDVSVTFSDWTLGGGRDKPSTGNTIAVTTGYRNHSGNSAENVKTYVFATAPVTLTAGKFVKSVRLPSKVDTGRMHVFAVAFGKSSHPTGPIVSGLSSSTSKLCLDDNDRQVTNGNKIQIWGCNNTAAQQWTVNPDRTLTVFGKCMQPVGGATGKGTRIELNACNGADYQVWQPGDSGSLVNKAASGMCLDVPNSTTNQGTQLQIYACNKSAAQKWLTP
jgi:predicted alpha-1,2-mannosidase